MIPEYEKRIAVRLSAKQREKIEELISAGTYKYLSHVIRAALDEFLC